MSTGPDFAAMLAEITAQSAPPDARVTGSAAPGPFSIREAYGEARAGEVATASDISADIAAAVAAGCLGMADRRLLRGDIRGAELWSDLATCHDGLLTAPWPPGDMADDDGD